MIRRRAVTLLLLWCIAGLAGAAQAQGQYKYFIPFVERPAEASATPSCSAIYPIGVDAATINGDTFVQTPDENGDGQPDSNWRVITSGPYRGYTARQLIVNDPPAQPGGFAFLRWKQATASGGASAVSAAALVTSLTGLGNLSRGFEEAPQPSLGTPPNPSYPLQPGVLGVGDWVFGTPGWKTGGTALAAVVGTQITAGRFMILPIYDTATGQGSGQAYRVTRFGVFVPVGQSQGANSFLLDLIFLGSSPIPCSGPPSRVTELTGEVAIWPEYKIIGDDGSTCNVGRDAAPTRVITPATFNPVTLPSGQTLTYPNAGVVTARNAATNASISTFVVAGTDGRIGYRFTSLPAGIYTLMATVYYKHPLEPAGIGNRAYNDFFNGTEAFPMLTVEVREFQTNQLNFELRLRGNVCAEGP